MSRRKTKMEGLRWIVIVLFGVVAPFSGSLLAEQAAKEVSGEVFWWMEKLGQIRNIVEGATEVSAEALGAHGFEHIRVNKEEFRDPWAKTAGYKRAMSQLITVMEQNKDFPALVDDYRTRLQEMANLPLQTASEWERWFAENRNYLIWSEKRQRFLVDTDAKKEGVPTREYRKSHPWAEGP